MANNSKNANDWLSFSKSERWAILIFSGLIVVINIIPHYYLPKASEPWVVQICQLEHNIDPLVKGNSILKEPTNLYLKKQKLSPVSFNPNQVTKFQLLQMGIPAKSAETWIHFLEKGGGFYKPTDLNKLYGLSPEIVEQLMPFVMLPSKDFSKNALQQNFKMEHPKEKLLNIVDINLADSISWEKLPGIGPSLARRIINFREKLGGFYSIEQVKETFGLQDSIFIKIKPQLKIGVPILRKIKINEADWSVLKDHPYIRSPLAGLILKYRKAHGRIANIEELNEIMQIEKEAITKAAPYLSFE